MAVELTREQARRIAVRAQLLDARPALRDAAGLRPAAPQGSDFRVGLRPAAPQGSDFRVGLRPAAPQGSDFRFHVNPRSGPGAVDRERFPEEFAGEAGQRLEGPPVILEVVHHLAFLQYDLTRAVAPSQHVVLWSRLGSSYSPAHLQDLLDSQELIELHMVIRPAADIALFTAEMAAWPTPGSWEQRLADWAAANADCRRDILELLRSDGPLPTSELPDTCTVPWQSTGWTHDKNVQKMLSALVSSGEVAISRREGAMPWWDLAERVYPDLDPVPLADAARERNRRRLVALGIARAKTVQTPVEPNDVGPVGVDAVVEGVRGTWRVDPDLLARVDEPFSGRAALLSPLDRLVFDRKRLAEIFEYDYALEMYKPAAQRIWGYWALPVLYGDRLIGKVDAIAERNEGELIVRAIHEDDDWTSQQRAAVGAELESLAQWLDLALVLP